MNKKNDILWSILLFLDGAIIVFFIFYYINKKKSSNDNISDVTEKIVEIRNKTSDGIVWYLLRKGDETAVEINGKIIIPFDRRQEIFFNEEDKKLHVKMFRQSEKFSYDNCMYGIYDLEGKAIISKYECYSNVSLKKLDGGKGYYYSTELTYDGKKHFGAYDKNGVCIIKPVSDLPVEYGDPFEGESSGGQIKMFYANINSRFFYTYYYLNDKYESQNIGTPKIIYYARPTDSNSSDASEIYQIALIGDYFFWDNKPYFYDHDNEDGSIYENDNSDVSICLNKQDYSFYYFNFAYSANFEKYDIPHQYNLAKIVEERNIRYNNIKNKFNDKNIDEFVAELNPKGSSIKKDDEHEPESSGDNSSQVNTSFDNTYPTYDNSSQMYYENTPREPKRLMCEACLNSGNCRVCNGTGKVKSYMSISYGHDVMEKCRACHGSGRCRSCKGDGWIDEGIDY